MSDADRIAELEIALAHQQKVCDDLNAVVTQQAADIEQIHQQLIQPLVLQTLILQAPLLKALGVDQNI